MVYLPLDIHFTSKPIFSKKAFNGLFWYSLANGSNVVFPTLNMMDVLSERLLPESGIMPFQFLVFPALIGVAVVGSFERRISAWIKKKKD